MNLTRVLNVALPEMPARTLSERPPRMPPDAVFKEHLEGGEPIVRVLIPSQDAMYRFPRQNWALIQLFDGQRSFDDIAEAYSQQTGQQYSVDEVREFAASLESLDFWYKTPQEKNIQLMQKTAEERRKLLNSKKSKFGDLAEIAFPAVNPDKFLTWLYKYTSFVYTPWFTVLTLASFAVMAGISIVHWSEIGRDTVQFFNFTQKSWGDVAVFYVLALSTMCIHELAHGHACKHFGGRVPSMGFMLIYLTPAFFTDTSEGFVKGSRYQIFIIAMAGAWSELIICAIATPIWWATPPQTFVHDAAYLLMLMTGLASLMINWNPLMKLDGYYMLCEAIGIGDLKEASTAFVSAWVKRHIWRLPVQVPYVPRRRRIGYAVYALMSGLYSYTILYILARFVGNVFRNFNPEWSFIPELGTAALIFRSRIRTLVNFMKFVYLDKKDRLRAWFGRRQGLMALGAFVLLIVLPVWRESTMGRFMLEAATRSVLRNKVPGTVTKVFATEGRYVRAGEPLIQLQNLQLETKAASTQADYEVSSKRMVTASMQYANVGSTTQTWNQLASQNREMQLQRLNLELDSPFSGTVLTPRLEDRLGSYIPEGTELVEIGDLERMRARVYVSEHDMYNIKVGMPARLAVEGIPRIWQAEALSITPDSSALEPWSSATNKYEGLNPPQFYLVDVVITDSQGVLKPGMLGSARFYSQRKSLAGLAVRVVARFFARKAW